MRPGMPPGRKHFRRSRDAPILGHSRLISGEWGLHQKRTCDRPGCQRAVYTLTDEVVPSNTLDEGEVRQDSGPRMIGKSGDLGIAKTVIGTANIKH
jgi:hypothetical protein